MTKSNKKMLKLASKIICIHLRSFNNYDAKGRITTNNKLGTITYNTDVNTGIYRKDKIALNTDGLSYYNALAGTQIVSYNMFKSPISINESNKGKTNFEYNAHYSRTKHLYDFGTTTASPTTKLLRKTKLYTDDGSTEVFMDLVANTVKIITFEGGDAYTATVYNEKILNKTTGVTTENKFYLHRDYQGTIIAISNQLGVAIEKRAFDAWGNLCKIVNSSNTSLPVVNGLVVFDRGYTGHEHLNEVRLIHMNGRLYDPMLRSFLMNDNFVSDPNNSQNYNRYSYVLNNPLRYVDINGEEPISLTIILIATVVSAYAYTYQAMFTNGEPFSFKGVATAALIGAVSATVTFGIGSAATSMFTQFASQMAFQAVAHATFQGVVTELSGGKFKNGFAAGALSSIASSLFGHYGGNFAKSYGGHALFGSVAGGVGAKLTSGNVWEGALTGFIVSTANHYGHQGDNYEDVDQEDPPRKDGLNIKKPSPLSLEEAGYKTEGKDWQSKGGRPTITTKKQILQWSPEGEVEVYNKGSKQHLGGFDPKNALNRTGPADSRSPNGGWKISTSRMFKIMSKFDKIMNYIPILNLQLPPLFEMQMQMLPGYVSPNKTIQTH